LNAQETRRLRRPVNTWKDGIRDSMLSTNLRVEEYFDCEVWREKIYVFVFRKPMYTENSSFNNKIMILIFCLYYYGTVVTLR
jgi:hypothetical protein